MAKVRRLVVMRAVAGSDWAHFGECCIGQLQGMEHVHIPVEEQAYLRRAAAGGAAHGNQAGNAIDGVLDPLGDGDLHLLDGHHAVVDPDHHAGKLVSGKTEIGTWNAAYIPASVNKNRKKKMVFAAPASQKDLSSVAFAGESGISPCLPLAAGAVPIFTLVPSSSP